VAAVASFVAAVSTEMSLCDVCSGQEVLRRDGRGQAGGAGGPTVPGAAEEVNAYVVFVFAVGGLVLDCTTFAAFYAWGQLGSDGCGGRCVLCWRPFGLRVT
jgi:hypothetical protein